MKIDWVAACVLLIIVPCSFLLWKKLKPRLSAAPVTRSVEGFSKGIRSYLASYSPYFLWASLICVAFALMDPEIQLSKKQSATKALPKEGIALYYILDQSGSMQEKVKVITDTSVSEIPKIDLAKNALKKSLQDRKDDLVGLIAFARVARVMCPLTLDQDEILHKLKEIQPLESDNVNGTAIGYAIFKAVNIFVATSYFSERQKEKHKPVYSIASKALVIVTDGLQSPNPEDRQNPFRFMPIDEAVRYAKQNGVRVYFIGVDPIFKRDEFSHDVAEIKEAVQETGGEFFITTQEHDIDLVLSKINTLEKSALPTKVEGAKQGDSMYRLASFFIAAALVFLAFSILLETIICRSVP